MQLGSSRLPPSTDWFGKHLSKCDFALLSLPRGEFLFPNFSVLCHLPSGLFSTDNLHLPCALKGHQPCPHKPPGDIKLA